MSTTPLAAVPVRDESPLKRARDEPMPVLVEECEDGEAPTKRVRGRQVASFPEAVIAKAKKAVKAAQAKVNDLNDGIAIINCAINEHTEAIDNLEAERDKLRTSLIQAKDVIAQNTPPTGRRVNNLWVKLLPKHDSDPGPFATLVRVVCSLAVKRGQGGKLMICHEGSTVSHHVDTGKSVSPALAKLMIVAAKQSPFWAIPAVVAQKILYVVTDIPVVLAFAVNNAHLVDETKVEDMRVFLNPEEEDGDEEEKEEEKEEEDGDEEEKTVCVRADEEE